MIKKILISSTLSAFVLVGCGSSTDTTTIADTTGYFVDAAVQNLDYDCIADREFNQTTAQDGAFTCKDMSQVRFRLGNLVLGEISTLPVDGYVMPQDLVDVNRTDIYNQRVTEIARLLQSCDSDGNATNGITITDTTKAELLTLDINTTFDENSTNTYLQLANQITTMTQTQARAHLHATLTSLQTSATSTTQQVGGPMHGVNGTTGTNTPLVDVNASPLSTLTEEVEDAIQYMINEEKLAYDVYMNLYTYHVTTNNTELFQLQNIASRSETTHIQLVEELATKYNLEGASQLDSGLFNVPDVQTLYDALYTNGTNSPEDALKAACMVEVTDINDLEADLILAQNSNAQDVIDVFTVLRDGGYNHYWAFDSGLKALGVTDGCCSVGTIDGINYCHPEYPQNTQGRP